MIMIHDNRDDHESCEYCDDHGDLDGHNGHDDHAGDDDDDLHISRRTFFLRLVLIVTYKKGWIMLLMDYVRIIVVY